MKTGMTILCDRKAGKSEWTSAGLSPSRIELSHADLREQTHFLGSRTRRHCQAGWSDSGVWSENPGSGSVLADRHETARCVKATNQQRSTRSYLPFYHTGSSYLSSYRAWMGTIRMR